MIYSCLSAIWSIWLFVLNKKLLRQQSCNCCALVLKYQLFALLMFMCHEDVFARCLADFPLQRLSLTSTAVESSKQSVIKAEQSSLACKDGKIDE